MDVEGAAVFAIASIVARTQTLKPSINTNDKEPSFDGFVCVYGNKEYSKDKIIGKVPVQVKGRREKLTKKDVSEPIEVSDLNNYINESGCMYFVVYIDQRDRCKIYYVELLPFYIKKILKNKETQKSINVPLRPLPKEPQKVEQLFTQFIIDKQKQPKINLLDQDVINAKIKNDDFEEFIITTSGKNRLDAIRALFEKPHYIYGKLKDGITIPIQYMDGELSILQKFHENICCNGQIFYEEYSIVQYVDKFECTFGKSIKLKTNKKDHTTRIDFTLLGSLEERIIDARFLAAMLESECFYVGSLCVTRPNLDEYMVNKLIEYKKIIENLEEFKATFDILNIPTEKLDIGSMTDSDHRNMSILTDSFLYNKQVKLEAIEDKSRFGRVTIGGMEIPIIALKDDATGQYRLYNIFDEKMNFAIKIDDNEILPAPIYLTFDRTDFVKYCNIDYDVMYKAIENVTMSKLHMRGILAMFLEMLHAYDQQQEAALLKCAIKIAIWLKDNYKDIDKDSLDLNYLQAIKRERELNKDEQNLLHEITCSELIEARIAAFLLLEQQASAEFHFQKLSSDIQEVFKTYPIYKYWDKEDK